MAGRERREEKTMFMLAPPLHPSHASGLAFHFSPSVAKECLRSEIIEGFSGVYPFDVSGFVGSHG